ncbi:MAG: helix-turn-helix domain-containing protein [Acidimicrobiales bacterium]
MTNHQLAQESSNFREAMVPEAPTLIDELESSAEGAQEMAAARLAVEVTASFSRAIRESGVSQNRLGEVLDLSPGAVSQVVNGDGNLRVSTLGRYFRALGYQARLFLEPVEPERRVIASRSTCAAIEDELREYARMALAACTTTPSQVAMPPAPIWALPSFPKGTAWQPVALQFEVPSDGQQSEVRIG